MSQWTVQDVLALSDERDAWIARVYAAERAGYERGLEVGREQGYRYALQEEAIERGIVGAPFRRPGPGFKELERRRWGRKGRAHFADPRPGDYLGGMVQR